MTPRRTQQQTLVDEPFGRRRRYCRRCGRELTATLSKLNGYGPDCDPISRTGPAAEHQVDQDAIPGT